MKSQKCIIGILDGKRFQNSSFMKDFLGQGAFEQLLIHQEYSLFLQLDLFSFEKFGAVLNLKNKI